MVKDNLQVVITKSWINSSIIGTEGLVAIINVTLIGYSWNASGAFSWREMGLCGIPKTISIPSASYMVACCQTKAPPQAPPTFPTGLATPHFSCTHRTNFLAHAFNFLSSYHPAFLYHPMTNASMSMRTASPHARPFANSFQPACLNVTRQPVIHTNRTRIKFPGVVHTCLRANCTLHTPHSLYRWAYNTWCLTCQLHPRKLGCGPTANTQHNSSDSIPPYIFFPLADCPCRQLMRLIPLSSRRAAPSKLSFIIANQRPVRFPFMSKLCEPPKDWRLQNMEAWNMAAQSWTLKGVFKCMLNPESFKGFEAEWCGVFRSPRFWPSPGEGNK